MRTLLRAPEDGAQDLLQNTFLLQPMLPRLLVGATVIDNGAALAADAVHLAIVIDRERRDAAAHVLRANTAPGSATPGMTH